MSFAIPTASAMAADHGVSPYETVAAVRLITGRPPSFIHVEDLGTMMRWMSASTDADDGVSVIKVTAITTGRYVAKY